MSHKNLPATAVALLASAESTCLAGFVTAGAPLGRAPDGSADSVALYARTALLLLHFAAAALLELVASLVGRGLDLVVRRNGSKLLSGTTIALLPHL